MIKYFNSLNQETDYSETVSDSNGKADFMKGIAIGVT